MPIIRIEPINTLIRIDRNFLKKRELGEIIKIGFWQVRLKRNFSDEFSINNSKLHGFAHQVLTGFQNGQADACLTKITVIAIKRIRGSETPSI